MSTALEFKRSLAMTLLWRMGAEGLSVSQLAAKTGCDRKVVRQVLDPKDTEATLAAVEKVAAALDVKVELQHRLVPLTKLVPLVARLRETTDPRKATALRRKFAETYFGKRVHLPRWIIEEDPPGPTGSTDSHRRKARRSD